jgi:hypothetical protein
MKTLFSCFAFLKGLEKALRYSFWGSFVFFFFFLGGGGGGCKGFKYHLVKNKVSVS